MSLLMVSEHVVRFFVDCLYLPPHTLLQVARPYTRTAARLRRSSSHPLQQPPAPKH